LETLNYIDKRLEESQVIDLIIHRAKCTYGNLDFFWEVTNVPRNEEFTFDTYFLAKEIQRTELGFNKDQKPGDIDIIIIPSFKGKMYFEFSSAFEVKIVRPTNKNYRKNSTSLGTTQIFGLIKDGYPLVGLIQVCMPEPITIEKLQHLPLLNDPNVIFTYDPFPLYSIDTQYKRILKIDLPKYVGINIMGFSFDKDDKLFTHYSTEFDKFKYAYFNPHCSKDTIEKIKVHFHKYREKYIEKQNEK
jgi:hypothetical protein